MTQPTEDPRPVGAWLDTKDVAALLRTTPKQVANMLARGQLPAAIRKPGLRGPRWAARAIEDWMQGDLGVGRAPPHVAPAPAPRTPKTAPTRTNEDHDAPAQLSRRS